MSHGHVAGGTSALAAQGRSSYPVEQEFSLELPLGYAPPLLATPPRIAVILHAYHVDVLPEIVAYLENIGFPADIFVSTDQETKRAVVARCFAGWARGRIEIRVMPNRGRDIAPKLVGFGSVHDHYEFVLHLHTKRSLHDPLLEGWRGYLLETLLGSPAVVRGVFEAFARQPQLGMLAPQHVEWLRPWIGWGENFVLAEALAHRMDIALTPDAPLDFPSGSMFWARSAALRPLLDLGLLFEDFPDENGQTDATLAHCIERLYFLVCERAGFDWMKIAARGLLHDGGAVITVRGPAALSRFLSLRRVRLADPQHEKQQTGPRIAAATPFGPPKRVMHVLWRRALGCDLPIRAGRQIAIALLVDESEAARMRMAHSAQLALGHLPDGARGWLLPADEFLPEPGEGGLARHNRALRAAFAAGADFVLIITAVGILYPTSIAAMLHMMEADDGLLEASRFPQARSKPVAGLDFTTSWAAGPCIGIPRAVFNAIGGFDERLAGRFAEMDLSWRARAMGFTVRQCPGALFLCAADDPAIEAAPALLAAGLVLAQKWGNAANEIQFATLLRQGGQSLSHHRPDPMPTDWQGLADFSGDPALAQLGEASRTSPRLGAPGEEIS